MRASEIANIVKYIEIEESEIRVYTKAEQIDAVYEYLCGDRAIAELDENMLILRKDPDRESKFNFVIQCAYVLSYHIPIEKNIPPDIFSSIYGYEEIKHIFSMSINAKKPVHILLWGPPSTAKTLFLNELGRLPDSVLFLGSDLTHAGLREVIVEYKPKFLLIDELDKVRSSKDLSSLLSWMEYGRLIVGKYKQYKTITGKGWVFAACNQLSILPVELLSRFMKFYLREYNEEEYKSVTYQLLVHEEEVDQKVATYISEKTWDIGYKDVRDAIRIGRLAECREDVDKILKIMQS